MKKIMTISQILEEYSNGERNFSCITCIILSHRNKIKKANFQGANLQEANFQGASLKWANLQGANLQEANFQGASLEWANLQGANLSEASLWHTDLQGANLSEANLSKVDLQGANLQGFNLRGATFLKANLKWANLQEANLEGAFLKGANLQETRLWHTDLQGANLQEANLEGAFLKGANLQGTNLQEASLINANLQETNFQKANFQKAKFDEKTQFPSGFDPIERGMLKVQPSQLHSSKAKNLSNTQDNQSSVVTSNNELPEISLSNFKTLEDFQENLKTEIKEPGFETNDQTLSQAFDLNKQEFLETETTQVDSQIDHLSSTIIDEKFNQEVIQDTPIDNQSEESQNFTEPESIPTQISAEQSVEVRELNAEEKQLEKEFYSAKSEEEARKKIRVSILARQGQPQFRQALLKAYNSRCAITGCDAELALEAAHIIPYSEQENNHPSNGLLLRADIHTLFDLNLIAIDPETMTIHLAPSLRETSYKELYGKKLRQPKDPADSPKLEALQWRYEQCEWMQR